MSRLEKAQPPQSKDYPPYDKENKEKGFTNFGYIRLENAFLILTFDKNTFLHVFKADSSTYQDEKEDLSRDEDIEIYMPHVKLEDLELLQIGGLEAPETKKASRVSRRGEDHYKFYGIDGRTQKETDITIPSRVVHDLLYDRSDQGLTDDAGFFEFEPGARDSVIAATFSSHIKDNAATIFIIQPEKESSEAGTTQYNSQRGLTRLLDNILSAILFDASVDQEKINNIIQMAINEDLIEYEVPDIGVDQGNFNEILRLVWHIKALIDTKELELQGKSFGDDGIIRDSVPWIKWGELNSFKKWLYKNQPTVVLEASNWQELLIEYQEFASVNYSLDTNDEEELMPEQRQILELKNKVDEIMRNATPAQKATSRIMTRALINGKVLFENDNNLEATQMRNHILTLNWRIDVLNKVYQAEKKGNLKKDKELIELVPWIEWDDMDNRFMGAAVKFVYKYPAITLKESDYIS
jgi:hypothetical protein